MWALRFLALGFAALTSCVSVMETLVANCMEIFKSSRKKMCAMIGIYSLVTAVLICLGYNVLYFELPLPNGATAQLLDVMDYISNSFLMPFISLLTSILIGWMVGPEWIISEVEKNGEHFRRAGMYRVMIRYVVPVVMLILFPDLHGAVECTDPGVIKYMTRKKNEIWGPSGFPNLVFAVLFGASLCLKNKAGLLLFLVQQPLIVAGFTYSSPYLHFLLKFLSSLL